MRPNRMIATLGLAGALVLGVAADAMAHGMGPGQAQQAYPPMAGCPYHGMGPGMMGPGMMGPGMMGPGMMGPGMMGPGMMGPGMMGPGMMGPGMMGPVMMGPGMMGPGSMGEGMEPDMMGRGMGPGAMPVLPQDLTPAQVRHMFEHRLEMQGNPNVKVGDVAEADEDTVTVDIVTQDGSLVQRFAVDRHTGAWHPAQ